jgi:folate-binding protein YgfZ
MIIGHPHAPVPNAMTASGAVALSHLGVMRASGADATAFLQSQLTNDVASQPPDRARLAGFCSAKGRLQASFIVLKLADDDLWLVCASDLLEATRKRLSMFVLRAKCRLSDERASLHLTGLLGEAARARAAGLEPWGWRSEGDGTRTLRLPDAAATPRAIVIGAGDAVAPDRIAVPVAPLDAWRWFEVESAIPLIEAATVDRFVPQMVNYEAVGGVDFQKGCYPGQEVVARSQYRGTIKRRMQRFDAAAPHAPADELFHDADPGQPAGLVVNAAPRPSGGWSALVEVKLAALDAGTLHARAPDGPPLERRPLPYSID